MTSVRNAQIKLNKSLDQPSEQVKDSSETVRGFCDGIVREVENLADHLDLSGIEQAAALIIDCERLGGRVHVTGVGKPGHVASYAASHFSSTGTSTYFLHATECHHGSAGQIRAGDVIIAISNSGETAELLEVVKMAKRLLASVIGVTGNLNSPLADSSDVLLFAGVESECDPLDLAPRASTIAQMIVLMALSISLQTRKGLTPEQYAQWHPNGVLGHKARKLLADPD